MRKLTTLLTVCLVIVGIMSCDVSGEQNYDFEVGNTPVIGVLAGSATAVAIPQDTMTVKPDTNDVNTITKTYYVKGNDRNHSYNWTVDPTSAKVKKVRGGGFLKVKFANTNSGKLADDTLETTISVKVEIGEEKELNKKTIEVASFRQSNEDAGIK